MVKTLWILSSECRPRVDTSDVHSSDWRLRAGEGEACLQVDESFVGVGADLGRPNLQIRIFGFPISSDCCSVCL